MHVLIVSSGVGEEAGRDKDLNRSRLVDDMRPPLLLTRYLGAAPTTGAHHGSLMCHKSRKQPR